MSNIKKFAVEETATLHLKDANDELMYADGQDGEPDKTKPMEVVLYGPGSKKYAKIQAANSNRLMTRYKKKGNADQSAEEKTRETADFLVACTKSFNNIDYDGAPLAGEALHLAVYLDISIGFVATQVNTYLGDWANFTKTSTPK